MIFVKTRNPFFGLISKFLGGLTTTKFDNFKKKSVVPVLVFIVYVPKRLRVKKYDQKTVKKTKKQ